MKRRSNYPLTIVKGRDLLQIAPSPTGQRQFMGFRNGRMEALDADAPRVLKGHAGGPNPKRSH